MNVGKVYLIGAGPGDVGLFTIKGEKVLKQADVVVYDALVGHGILSMIPKSARLINVGKRAGNHTMAQEDINGVLLAEAMQGNVVVRLKGGDPFLFGRGGEELELLVKEDIPYEVIPGVTSAIAVPAYNGIPVTHRDFCSSLHIITGHKRKGQDYNIDFDALVRTKGTLVFLMGITAMADICRNLMTAGMPENTPAAVLQQGTTAKQKRVVATLATLVAEVERQGIETPAIIVVGEVCQLADEFAWYEKLPLAGFKVMVTRPKELISVLSEKLREKGAEVLELPAVETVPIANPKGLSQAIEKIEEYKWIVFTSPTGVRVFFERLHQMQKDVRILHHGKFAVIGEGTKKALREYGIFADFTPTVYDGEHLGKELAKECNPKDKILMPRASIGNQELVKALEDVGAIVDDIGTYDTIYQTNTILHPVSQLETGNIHCVVFTSSSIVRAFVKNTEGLDYTKVVAACIGKQTKETADKYGMQTYMSEKATIESLVDLVNLIKTKG